MPRRPGGRIGALLTLYALYRRLPVEQRRLLFAVGRRHGPRLALRMWSLRRRMRP
jgi:hypothetical protein